MILSSENTIFSKKGVERKELLKIDQALIYRSPSKISTIGYAGKAERVNESTTIPKKYFSELSKIKGFISLGTTGVGDSMEHKNIHLYSEQAIYLDGVNRICYLFEDGNELKICEYKKGSRGSRYSSLFKILEDKLSKLAFAYKDACFLINEKNISQFVVVINEINIEQNEEKYELVMSDQIDELSAGVFNIAYWQCKEGDSEVNYTKEVEEAVTINHELINRIESCRDINVLFKLEEELTTILAFCKSKIGALTILKQ